MNSKSARQILLCRRPGGEDDSDPAMKRAMAVAAKDRSLAAEFQKQSAFDRACADDLEAISLDEDSRAQIDEGARAFAAKHGGARMRIGKHAAFAVGVGFLLLVGLLVWMVLGRAGIFPDEAVKISMTGAKATPNQFDPVEEKADALQDWFMLKGFDNFRVPPEFAQFDVVGVRIFTVDNEPVAQVAVPENLMYFYCFSSQPLGINVVPEGSWRITESDRSVLAIREEKGMCFLVAFRGSKKDMKSLLEKAGALR
ncbi:MAG: hypothetical protein ABW214_02750 [Terrimicrobiaceae bacterium]